MAALQGRRASEAAPSAPNGNVILEALANMARQKTSAASAAPSLPAPTTSYSLPVAGLSQPVPPAPQAQLPVSYPPTSQPVNVPSLPFGLPQMPGQGVISGALPNNASNAFPTAPASAGNTGSGLDPNVQHQILLIKALADQGVPFDKIPALIQSMNNGNAGAATMPQPPAPQSSLPVGQQGNAWGAAPIKADESRDRGYQDHVRSPPRYRGRSRSRSPDRGWGTRGSPRNGRDRLDYGRDSPNRGRHDDRRGGDYRQRSPPGRRGRSPSPSRGFPHVEKWVDFDPNLPSGHIKVLSRTLFVGGVT